MKKFTFHQNVSVSVLDYDSTSAPRLPAALRLFLDKNLSTSALILPHFQIPDGPWEEEDGDAGQVARERKRLIWHYGPGANTVLIICE